MVDQPYLTWTQAFEVFNVRGSAYAGGALGDGSHDDLAAIQATVNAALARGGGIVYFPPGVYKVSNMIYVSGAGVGSQCLRFVGSGGLPPATGSTITTSAATYILYSSMLGTVGDTVASIEHLNFENTNTSATIPTQIEPPSNPDGVGYSGNGLGCVYIGKGIGTVVKACNFRTNLGVGYFHGGFQGSVENCNFQGSFATGDSINESIGIMSRALNIRNSKISGFGHGVAMFKGHSQLEFCDIERCGIGILIGAIPVAYQDSNEVGPPNFIPALQPAGNLVCAKPGIYVNNIVMEACGVSHIKCQVAGSGEIRNVQMQSDGDQVGLPDYGLDATGADGIRFHNIDASAAYNVAAINVGGGRCEYHYCSGAQLGGAGTGWVFPSSQLVGVIKFVGCLNNGHILNCALPLSLLPPGGYFDGETMECSDSIDPAVTAAGLSNVGKRILGTGGNRVTARYGALATATASGSWTAGGASTTITATAAIPASIVAGAHVWSTSVATKAEYFVGYISSVSGSTVTVTPGASAASGGSSDKLIFAAWLIAG